MNPVNVKFFIGLILTSTLIFSCQQKTTTEPWKDLFDGKSLQGWSKKGGDATYEIKDGTIVGHPVVNTENTFMCTDELYDDFILEYEVKLTGDLNSGVQIRSNSFKEYNNYRVHGYQVEIDPSDRGYSGGIYDEARRGWLHTVAEETAKNSPFKLNEWNKYRVEAINDTIKTWLNGVPIVHLVDDMTKKGFIGLQVHAIGDDKEKEDITVSWRNIHIITDNPRKYAKETPLPAKDNYNKLTSSEEDWGWQLLWDGKTAEGWRGANLDTFPSFGWVMHDGILTIKESGGEESENAGDIVTRKKYSDFILRVDFKITPGANSGIKYFVDTELNKSGGSAIGLEYQILDDERHPDAKKGNHEGSRTLASLYDLIKAENKYPNPIGEWNHARIISDGQHVEHWLNGRKVLEYERGSENYKKLVSESKYHVWDNFGQWSEGNILLQDHGNRVSFRNIKIKVLNNEQPS